MISRIAGINVKGLFSASAEVSRRSSKNCVSAFLDIIACGLRYQAGYSEYLLFEFENLSPAQRATYVTRGKNNGYVKKLNPPEERVRLDDKGEFLRSLGSDAGRLWLDLRVSDSEKLAELCRKCRRIVAKPVNGCCGRGIEFIDTADICDHAALFSELSQKGCVIVEDCLKQHPVLSAIYPLSVNTLRLVTIRTNGSVKLVFSCLRIGNGKNVDNLNSGGLCVIVDSIGRISSPGADKTGSVCNTHPVTGYVFSGTQIPFFAEAVALVNDLHNRFPGLGYIGWDIAVTPDGPVYVEANPFPGNDIYQLRAHLGSEKTGLAPVIEAAINN
ncbi:MAG: sugar-transfer associated ATP-grasp domain-containing protein [Eubacteriales bacterium]